MSLEKTVSGSCELCRLFKYVFFLTDNLYCHTRLCGVQDDHSARQEGMGTQGKETIKRRKENEEKIKNRLFYLFIGDNS